IRPRLVDLEDDDVNGRPRNVNDRIVVVPRGRGAWIAHARKNGKNRPDITVVGDSDSEKKIGVWVVVVAAADETAMSVSEQSQEFIEVVNRHFEEIARFEHR